MIDLKVPCTTAVQLDFNSDASASEVLGFGGVFNKRWLYGAWPPNYIRTYNPSIAYLELYALTACVLAWEAELHNLRMILFCDNQSVVQMINSTSSKCINCMFLLHILVLSGLRFNRRIYASYINTKLNDQADALSRLKLGRFFKICKSGTDAEPTQLPAQIWPIDKIWQRQK